MVAARSCRHEPPRKVIGSLPHKVQDDHEDTDTPGWDAINAALAPLYAGQEPRHYGTALP